MIMRGFEIFSCLVNLFFCVLPDIPTLCILFDKIKYMYITIKDNWFMNLAFIYR